MAQHNRVSGKFEFSNRGTLHSFDPNRMVYDNINGGNKITLLELHMELVRQHNSKEVFVIDSKGNIVGETHRDGTQVTYHKPRPSAKGNSAKGNNRRPR